MGVTEMDSAILATTESISHSFVFETSNGKIEIEVKVDTVNDRPLLLASIAESFCNAVRSPNLGRKNSPPNTVVDTVSGSFTK